MAGDDDPILARIDRHMADGNEIMIETKQVMRENTRAFEDLRAFLGQMTEVLHTLVRTVEANTAELSQHRLEWREEGRALRAEFRAQQQELREEFRAQQQKIRDEMSEEFRAAREEFREEGRMQRAALVAILDQLRGGGPGAAPAT